MHVTGLVRRSVDTSISVCVPSADQPAAGSPVLAPEQMPLLALGAGTIGLFSPCEEEAARSRHSAGTSSAQGCG